MTTEQDTVSWQLVQVAGTPDTDNQSEVSRSIELGLVETVLVAAASGTRDRFAEARLKKFTGNKPPGGPANKPPTPPTAAVAA